MWRMSTRPKRPILEVNGESLGCRIRRLRKAKGLTQGELGEALGVSVRAVCSYERDECAPPANVLLPMAEALGVDIRQVMGAEAVGEEAEPGLERRWVRKLRDIQELPERQQRAIMQVLDMALKSNG
jgi:transcriptional regulator with XRE-family HTH domain